MNLYHEKELQPAAVRWMSHRWGYLELAADFDARGDRIDTVRWLGSELIGIEVKFSVNAGMIYHKPTCSGSIEAKFAATLRSLYRATIHEHQPLHSRAEGHSLVVRKGRAHRSTIFTLMAQT